MKKYIIIFAIIPFLTSCEAILFEDEMKSQDPKENFEYMWKEADRKYSFFDYKGIDWDAKHDEYAAQIYDGMSKTELFNVIGAMLLDLRDGHTNLISDFNVSHFNMDLLGPKNYDARLVKEHYLSPDYYITGPFKHDFISNNEIGYIRFDAFTGTVTDDQIAYMFDRYANCKGLIFDIRSNGGGAVTDMYTILSHFVTAETVIFRNRYKTGPGHDDFSDPEDAKVSPAADHIYTKKVMVLTDRGTYSAGSFTSLSTKQIPNMVLVGDTTGGGLGLPNGGQLPNGWTYRFSVSSALDLMGNNYENGVPPDIYVILDQADVNNGVDTVIERAIQELQ